MRLRLQPCKDCQDRRVGCHSECEKYKEAVEDMQEAKEKAKQNCMANEVLFERRRRIQNYVQR